MWVASAVVVLAVVAAAWGGSWEVQHRDWDLSWLDRLRLPTAELPQGTVPEPAEPADAVEQGDGGWLGAVIVVVAGAVASAVALFVAVRLAQGVWAWLQDRGGPRHRPVPPSPTAVADLEPELPVLRRGVVEAQRHLAEIERPVDAVVAAWLALEEAAASSGVRRSPAQTPTEFTVAVLERTDADPDATSELLALYHRARFSRLPIGSSDVAVASRCLARLAAGWAAVTVDGGVSS